MTRPARARALAARIATRLPVFAAPMLLVSGPPLVLAACRAGIVGAFPSHNARTAEQFGEWMATVRQELELTARESPDATVGPWCVNIVTHSTNSRLAADLEQVARHRPPIVVTALGGPKPVMDIVHGYGGLVIADVINMSLARKAIAVGVDGLACIAAGAGGHTGFLSPFAFIAAIRAEFDGLIVAGGGIGDGHGVAGAITAGADFVYMGTRFIPSAESSAQPAYKQMVVDASVDDLVVSAAVTGAPASWLKPSLRAAGLDPDSLPAKPDLAYDASNGDAKRWRDIWAAGQGVGASRAIEPVAEIVDQVDAEYRQALAQACARLGTSTRDSA